LAGVAIRAACSRGLAVSVVVAGLFAGVARAAGPVGADPVSNFPAGTLPNSCRGAPNGTPCVNAGVYYLDQARAGLGQPAYALPADFVSLAADQQALILTNLDRILYGLPPITGLTQALDQDAAQGIQIDNDPHPSDPSVTGYTANWGGGYENMTLAYQGWLYDDGPGANNVDCTPANTSGCWGHRHDVLWQFGGSGQLGMGAATGVDPSGNSGYAILLGSGNSSYAPVYSYTWQQALADGAGTNAYAPGLPQIPVSVEVIVRGPGRVSDQLGQSCPIGSCALPETQGVATTFIERADAHARFVGWRGACSGAGQCSSTPVGWGTSLTAVFANIEASPVRLRIISVHVTRHTITVKLSAPTRARLSCSLTPRTAKGWGRDHFSRCGSTDLYRRVGSGRYRLRVRDDTQQATRVITVR
jgi:hypothetical protein